MYAYENKSTETEKHTGRGEIIRALSLLHHCILFYPEGKCRGIRGHSELYLQTAESMSFTMFQ